RPCSRRTAGARATPSTVPLELVGTPMRAIPSGITPSRYAGMCHQARHPTAPIDGLAAGGLSVARDRGGSVLSHVHLGRRWRRPTSAQVGSGRGRFAAYAALGELRE